MVKVAREKSSTYAPAKVVLAIRAQVNACPNATAELGLTVQTPPIRFDKFRKLDLIHYYIIFKVL